MFVAQTSLTWRLAVDLLDKMNNPDNHQPYGEVDDDDLEVTTSSRPAGVSQGEKAHDVFVAVAQSVGLKAASAPVPPLSIQRR